MDDIPIDEFIKKLLVEEEEIDQILNKITEGTQVNIQLNHDIKKIQNSIQETNNDINLMNNNSETTRADYEIVKIQQEAWLQTFEIDSKKHDNLKLELEKKQRDIWNLRRTYCDEVRKFIEKFGVKATIASDFKKDVRKQLASALNDIDVNSGKEAKLHKKSEEILRIEQEMDKEKSILEEYHGKLKRLQKDNEILHDSLNSAEFESLRSALKYSIEETTKNQNEINVLQARLDYLNSEIIRDLFDENVTSNGAESYMESKTENPSQIDRNSRLESSQNNWNSGLEFKSANKALAAKQQVVQNRSSYSEWNDALRMTVSSHLMATPSQNPKIQSAPSIKNNIGNASMLSQSGSFPGSVNENFQYMNPSPAKKTNLLSVQYDPYKRIMEMKNNQNNKVQKNKFHLANTKNK